MAGHGGGAWKVAYADFVTAMMAFFMVMWITAQNKQMKMAVAHYFNDPFNSLSKTKGPEAAGSITTGPLSPGSKTLVTSPKAGNPIGAKRAPGMPPPVGRKIQENGPKAWSGEGNRNAGVGKPTLFRINDAKQPGTGTVLLFAGDSKDLSDQAKEQLKKVILPLLMGKRQKIEIRGHARQRPAGPGGQPDPWQLSYDRCVATMKSLLAAGVEGDRFRLSAAGPYEPHTIRDGAESRTQNSCVEIIILPELADDYFGSREERDSLIRGP
jgi:chemotaxis protein MotB